MERTGALQTFASEIGENEKKVRNFTHNKTEIIKVKEIKWNNENFFGKIRGKNEEK